METDMSKKFIFALLCSLLAAVVLVGAALAQSGTPQAIESITDDQVNLIAKQLYCPVCENIPLDVCPTQACAEWRELIRLRLSQGWSEEEIKADFATQYGDRVLATPPAKGLNVLVYIIPPLAILAGAVILIRSLQAMRRGSGQALPATSLTAAPDPEAAQSGGPENGTIPQPGKMDEYMRRVEEELRKR
jgi:cytochrome c-type biogenesis protein CcmH